jgi:hypothetical protein
MIQFLNTIEEDLLYQQIFILKGYLHEQWKLWRSMSLDIADKIRINPIRCCLSPATQSDMKRQLVQIPLKLFDCLINVYINGIFVIIWKLDG